MDDRWPPPYGDGDETRRIDRFGQQHQQAPSGSSWRNPRFWGLFTGIVAITIVAVVAMFFIGIGEPADEAQQQSGGEVFLEPVASTGRDPFTPPVSKPQPPVTDPGTDPLGPASPAPGNKTFAPAPTTPADTPAATPTTSVRTANGDLPGLYGGTRDMTTCDPELLIRFLAENPDKGRAWAGVHGITPEQIPDYVRALTPVLLRTDTRVTNHGFKDGRATVLQSVLQEGTAVMVDAEGVPRAMRMRQPAERAGRDHRAGAGVRGREVGAVRRRQARRDHGGPRPGRTVRVVAADGADAGVLRPQPRMADGGRRGRAAWYVADDAAAACGGHHSNARRPGAYLCATTHAQLHAGAHARSAAHGQLHADAHPRSAAHGELHTGTDADLHTGTHADVHTGTGADLRTAAHADLHTGTGADLRATGYDPLRAGTDVRTTALSHPEHGAAPEPLILVGQTKGLGGRVAAGNSPARAGFARTAKPRCC
ncbi:hypothetical protein NM203_04565 [Mycolicibacterium sp. CAU 1645]|uniref:DUF6777 domain-containing protein n=1 Tax=Mycolicibacterium arenosum TaxID=2952157 RepID=A0ABT1LX55_9MYCO|nr:DUF6777 domain-containing protein [Mycolicibacterium sp. CAU 1645]MCP9271456.1 hypothetical protein [Mycolicibacterium sp. CAU 1645]